MAPRIRICTEVPVGEEFPRDEDSVYLVGLSKLQLEEDRGDDVKPQKHAMAVRKSVYWKPGTVIRVRFLSGKPSFHEKVQYYAKKWEKHANIKFDFVSRGPSDIRISFDQDDGSYSKVGTEALQVSAKKATMNLAIRSSTPSKDVKAEVLHEFGHALGLGHEHCSPAAGIKWDRKAVYKFYKQGGWSKEVTKIQVLKRYERDATQFSEFDPDSIMIYSIPSELTTDGFSVPSNRRLSKTDKKFIAKIYPKSTRSSVQTSEQSQVYNRQLPVSVGVGQTRGLDPLEILRSGRLAPSVAWARPPSPAPAPYPQAVFEKYSRTVQRPYRQQFVPVVQPQNFLPFSYNSHFPQCYGCGVGLTIEEYYDGPHRYSSDYVDG